MAAKQVQADEIAIPASLIDDFGVISALRDKLQADLAPTEKLYQKMKAELAAYVADAPVDQAFLEAGERYTLEISERRMERRVDIAAARRKLGAAGFLEICTVTMTALNQVLPKPEVEALTFSEQSGARSYVAAPIPGAYDPRG